MRILFIEDDFVESMKLKRTMVKFAMNHTIVEAKNGEEALRILHSGAHLPDLILLDLNMPRMNGTEFLRGLKSDRAIKYLPTVVLTTSQNRTDLLACYALGIAGYILKPLKYEDYEDRIKRLISYWEMNEFVKA